MNVVALNSLILVHPLSSNYQLPSKKNWPTMICEECRDHIDSARVYREKILSTQSHLQKLMDEMEMSVKKEQMNPVPDPLHTSEDEAEEEDTNDGCPLEDSDPVDEASCSDIKQEEQEFEDKSDLLTGAGSSKAQADKIANSKISGLRFRVKPTQKKPCEFCEFCGRGFTSSGRLVAHQYSKHRDEIADQPSCDYIEEHVEVSPSDGQLKQRIRVRRKTIKQRSEICQFCGRGYTCRARLIAHQSVKHEEEVAKLGPDYCRTHEKYICDICGREYDRESCFTSHLKTHEEWQGTDKCEVCGNYYADLKRHSRVHEEDRKQTCPICGVQCLYLKGHMRVHAPPSFKCEFCGKLFVMRKALQRHLRIHTAEKMRCLFCPHEATQDGNTRRHMKAKHPAEYAQWMAQKHKRLSQQIN